MLDSIMRWILLLIAAFALSIPSQSAQKLKLKFKDGTTLDGAEIYVPTINHSTGHPNGYGIILKYHSKLYIHHFPYRKPRKVSRFTNNGIDDGKYKAVQVIEELEHYSPRSSRLEPSPGELGYSCTPSRLSLIHISEPTRPY